eukprot:1345411-Pyramimonas_sp.AAC.1
MRTRGRATFGERRRGSCPGDSLSRGCLAWSRMMCSARFRLSVVTSVRRRSVSPNFLHNVPESHNA